MSTVENIPGASSAALLRFVRQSDNLAGGGLEHPRADSNAEAVRTRVNIRKAASIDLFRIRRMAQQFGCYWGAIQI